MKTIRIITISLLTLFVCGCGSFNPQYRNVTGTQLYNDGKYAEALQAFQSAIEANPNDADGYYNIAAVHHHIAQISKDKSQYLQAEQNYVRCLDINPNHVSAYRGLSVWLMEHGDKEKAFSLLQAWETANPTAADPKIELARLYQEDGQIRKAIDTLVAAVALDSQNARAYRALGALREENSEFAQAISNYKSSLQFDPNQPALADKIALLEARSKIY